METAIRPNVQKEKRKVLAMANENVVHARLGSALSSFFLRMLITAWTELKFLNSYFPFWPQNLLEMPKAFHTFVGLLLTTFPSSFEVKYEWAGWLRWKR
jgi:hypothetical protein